MHQLTVLVSTRKVLVFEDQFTSPFPWTLSPCPWTTKSSKIVKDLTFCKQSVMYHDHVKSMNSVTATVHEIIMKMAYLLSVSKLFFAVLLSSRKVLVLKDPRGPIYKSLSLSSDFKSLFLSLSSDHKSLRTSLLVNQQNFCTRFKELSCRCLSTCPCLVLIIFI